MKVILLDDIENLGNAGAAVEVSPGYGRNFLLPRKLAVPASPAREIFFAEQQKRKLAREEKERDRWQMLAERLNGRELRLEAEAGESGRLFGAVTAQDISAALARELGAEVDKRKILISAPLKQLGIHEVTVKFLRDIKASIKVNVVPKT